MSALIDLHIPKTYVLLATTSIALVSALGVYLYQRKSKKPPEKWEAVGKVTELYIYPLKSGRRIAVNKAECIQTGFKQTKEDEKAYQMRDRSLVVYGEKDSEFRTARTYPKMVLIEVSVHDEDHLAFDAPGMKTLHVKRPKMGENKAVYVKWWRNEKIHALDCGDEAASWFSRYIQDKSFGLRLGYHAGVHQRDIKTAHKNSLKFYTNFTNDSAGLYTDLSGAHILNVNSVEDLNKRIGKPIITVHNFRPSIVVDCPAYIEDNWNWIKIGDAIFRVIKPCTRCSLTTIDQETGERNKNGEPLKTLKTYQMVANPELRKMESNSPIMGVHTGVRKTGFLSTGDMVYVGVN